MSPEPPAPWNRTSEPPAPPQLPDWTIDAADLLGQPDPGPTQFLIEDVLVDGALAALVGRWKAFKTYATMDAAISVASGRPFLGRYAIHEPGPVLYVIEESGRSALWRRLDALSRGRATPREELRGLHFATNERVKLDDPEWIDRICSAVDTIRPRLIVFDPLARLKSSTRNENAQVEMAAVIENLRIIRDHACRSRPGDGCTALFVHHTGHQGDNMRGSSDLESVWETRLTFKREAQSTTVEIACEHREAEPGEPIVFRARWDGDTRTMRLDADEPDAGPTLADRILEHLAEHGPNTTDEVRIAVGVRKQDVQRTLEHLESHGTTHRGQSGRQDRLGRPIRDKVWKLTEQEALWPVPETGNSHHEPQNGHRGPVGGPPSLEGGHGNSHPDEPHIDPDELDRLEALALTMNAEAPQ